MDENIHDNTEYNENKSDIILVGNKIDCDDKINISSEEGLNITEKYNIEFIETSAKNGTNVNNAFMLIVDKVFNRLLPSPKNIIDNIKINITNDDNNKLSCCQK